MKQTMLGATALIGVLVWDWWFILVAFVVAFLFTVAGILAATGRKPDPELDLPWRCGSCGQTTSSTHYVEGRDGLMFHRGPG